MCKLCEAENKIREATEIINNSLYFNDSSDFVSDMWRCLSILNPEMFIDSESPELEFID